MAVPWPYYVSTVGYVHECLSRTNQPIWVQLSACQAFTLSCFRVLIVLGYIELTLNPDVSPDNVVLEALMNCVQIKSLGWELYGAGNGRLELSASTSELRLMTVLRPGDVFFVGKITLSVQVLEKKDLRRPAEVQVTSSGHNDVTTEDMLDVKDEPLEDCYNVDQASELRIASMLNCRSSTPTIPSSRPLAVMETPTAVRIRQIDSEPVAIMSSVDGNSTKDPPVLSDATNALAIEQPIVQAGIRNDGTGTKMQPHFTSLLDGNDEQPSSTADEDSSHSSPTPKPEASGMEQDRNQYSMRSTIQVEIPIRKETSRERTSSTKKRKPKPTQDSAEPTSSSRSTRSNPREDSSSLSLTHSDIRVMFTSSTSSDKSPPFMKFLKKQGVKIVKSVAECTMLCVGKGAELKKTSNLILAVSSGKDIITDDWISRSATKGELLDSHDFIAKDPKRETEWGTTLSDAIRRGRQGVRPLLGYTIHFTPSAKQELGKGFSDMKEIAVHAGADCIKVTVPRKSSEESPMTMVIAASDDGELSTLEERSWKAYSREIITLSVLRGTLDLNSDEFLVSTKTTNQRGRGRKRKR